MRSFYAFIISLFFIGIFFYLINYALVPYKSDGTLDMKNFTIVLISFVLVIASLFTFIHVSFDKLFFRKFYEKPSLVVATRRGILLGFFLAGLIWLRVFGFWMWHIVIFYAVLIILIEAFILAVQAGFGSKKGKNEKEKEKLVGLENKK